VEHGKSTSPTFREALETQAVCDAVLTSAKGRSWEDVKV
jgi:DNA mismatch repair protein MutH